VWVAGSRFSVAMIYKVIDRISNAPVSGLGGWVILSNAFFRHTMYNRSEVENLLVDRVWWEFDAGFRSGSSNADPGINPGLQFHAAIIDSLSYCHILSVNQSKQSDVLHKLTITDKR